MALVPILQPTQNCWSQVHSMCREELHRDPMAAGCGEMVSNHCSMDGELISIGPDMTDTPKSSYNSAAATTTAWISCRDKSTAV
jgi:hypothetical protein